MKIAIAADKAGQRVNWVVERICALMMAVMVLAIWLGVLERYFLGLGMTWTEEFSRYVMIWAALLAISCCAYRREHIGLDILMQLLPGHVRPFVRFCLDCIGLAFFLFMTYYGIGMVGAGTGQYATIFGMTMFLPFASVPVASGLTSFQILVTMIRDLPSHKTEIATREAAL